MNQFQSGPSRRDFLGWTAAAGLGALVSSCQSSRSHAGTGAPFLQQGDGLFRAPKIPEVRIGFVGVGGMGSAHVNNLLRIPGCRIAAVCDIVESKVARVQEQVAKAGFARPSGYSRGPTDFERMCAEEDLDLVYTATPWEWHVPVMLAAMKNGKHAATEVPAAYTVDDCWAMVETAEATQKHCVMMENCCYDRPEMMILHMVRKGVFGELLHGECGYLHDLREIKFSTDGEGLWRRQHAMKRNENLYTTHGLGPIAQCMNVNRGDQFDWIVSASSKTRGLELFAKEHFPEGDPRRNEKFLLGDVNVSLIRTKGGCTIYLAHNCDNPRPYSRILGVQGTKAIFQGYPHRIHIEGVSPGHTWEDWDKYLKQWDHPLWKREEEKAKGAGHGGMDFLEDVRLIESLRNGEPMDMDVYDAAAWSVVGPLSGRSVANNGESQKIPDFTRGAWQRRAPLGIVGA